jgi:hypothetical protein
LNEKEVLHRWVNKKNLKSRLLMRGTVDGFTKETFWNKCIDKGSLLILVKSEHNQIFGGYSSISWHKLANGQDTYKRDDASFIFSLSGRTKHQPY